MSAPATTKPPLVPGVETLPCPAADGGTHRLTNRGLGTVCSHCGATWADLDADLRARITRPTHHRKGRKP